MDKRESSSDFSTVTDVVNLSLAIFAWILPDIPITAKILISLILVGIFIIGRRRPSFIVRLTTSHYIGLLILTTILGIAEVWAAWQLLTFFTISLDNQPPIFQVGIFYALGAGLPTVLSTRAEGGTPTYSYFIGVLVLPYVLLGSYMLSLMFPFILPSSFKDYLIIFYGPALPLASYIGSFFPEDLSVLSGLIFVVVLAIQNIPFVWIGKWSLKW
jgi:hypothetical protein